MPRRIQLPHNPEKRFVFADPVQGPFKRQPNRLVFFLQVITFQHFFLISGRKLRQRFRRSLPHQGIGIAKLAPKRRGVGARIHAV
jgi:hypothetical protein